MIPYCVLFLLVDSLVVWRVIAWFNARLKYTDVLPIRASAYILSLVNEQVSKGAIALYLSRRNGIPGWEVGSSMLFIMFCEYYYLLAWATVGVALRWDRFPAVFHAIPWIAVASAIFFVLFYLFFSGRARSRERAARSADLPRVPARQVLPLRGRPRAPLAASCWRPLSSTRWRSGSSACRRASSRCSAICP